MDVPASQHAAWEDMLFDSKGRPRMTLSELIAEGMDRDEAVAEVAQLEQQVERLEALVKRQVEWYEEDVGLQSAIVGDMQQALAQQE